MRKLRKILNTPLLATLLLATLLLATQLAGCECGPESPVADDDSTEAPSTEPSNTPTEDPPAQREASLAERLFIDPQTIDFHQSSGLLRRLRESPHNYFRFVRSAFTAEVCRQFESGDECAPTVNLHGDAHLEQYAITDLGRGLTDFDGATTGPAVIDLVRMAVSIQLACETHHWDEHTGTLVDLFVASYRTGVSQNAQALETLPPEPALVAQIRSGFSPDRGPLLQRAAELTDTLSASEVAAAVEALRPYTEAQYESSPELDPRFFELVSIGQHTLGIGSALDEKYLFRVRGPSDLPGDDEILEMKEVRALGEIPCIVSSGAPDPLRILIGEARIAYQPFPYLGFLRSGPKVFWVHGWTANYREISVADSLTAPDDLRALVADIGLQMGRGHVNRIAAPLDAQLRRSMGLYLDNHTTEIREVSALMSEAIRASWRRFVSETETYRSLPGQHGRPHSVFRRER